jgi:hypothetical protein
VPRNGEVALQISLVHQPASSSNFFLSTLVLRWLLEIEIHRNKAQKLLATFTAGDFCHLGFQDTSDRFSLQTATSEAFVGETLVFASQQATRRPVLSIKSTASFISRVSPGIVSISKNDFYHLKSDPQSS